MNVVQVIYGLSIGGSEVLAKNIALALKKDGHNPAICAIEHGGELEAELNSNSIPYKVLGRGPREYIRTMKKAYRFFRSVNADVVHTHHLHELFYSAIPARLAGARLVHTEHEYFSLIPGKKRLLLKFFSILCDRITGVEDEVTDFLRTEVYINVNKLLTIKNGVDAEMFDGNQVMSKRDIGLSENDRVIGIVARLERAKDHKTLISAFSKVSDSYNEARLLIVGDGSMREELENECISLGITDKVIFLGSRRDIPELLAIMDVFVLSSVEEGLPISLLEAMASGRPVIATEVGSIPNTISDGVNGILVPPGSPSQIAHAIVSVLSDVQYALKLGQAAKKFIKENYDFESAQNKYTDLYVELHSRL